MTPPAGPSMSFGSGPPPVPLRRPQSELAPPLRRLWPSSPSVVCSMYLRPRLVLHQCVRSSGPGPCRGRGVLRSAGAAPLPIQGFQALRRHRQHVLSPHARCRQQCDGPGPRRGCCVRRSAGAAPLPIPAFRRYRQHVSRSYSLPAIGSSATSSSKECNLRQPTARAAPSRPARALMMHGQR